MPSPKELTQQRKWANYVGPPPKIDWPNIHDVREKYPHLCDEEHGWILEDMIYERLQENKNETNNEL